MAAQDKDYLFNPARNPMIRADYRPAEYKIDTVNLHINLDKDNTEVRNNFFVERNPAVADLGGPLVLDGENLSLVSVKIRENGVLRDLDRQEFIVTDKNLIIKRPPAGRFELEIVNEVDPSANTELEGIYTGDQAGEILCSQCESQGFRRISYFLDRPDNLAVFTTTLEADKEKYPVLLSNGNGDPAATKDLGNGRHQITWADPWPKPSYLFAVVAGDLKVLEDTFTTMSGKKVDLRIFVQAAYEDKIAWAMESVKNAMKWDEVRYGREYDLDCFHVVAVDKFNAGAMENKGLNIFNVARLVGSPETSTDGELLDIEGVIGHEYSHNYTGNRVTVRDWFEISLKESLTDLRTLQFSSDMHSAAITLIDEAIALRSSQFPEDASPRSHCVRPERVEVFDKIYSATIYGKGSHVLRMMNTILGDTLWRKAMDNYFDKFDGQAVTVDDFIDNMQDVSGIDLSQFRRWYTQSGTPEVSYEGKYDAATQTYSLTLKQHTPATADQTQDQKKNLHIPVSVGLIGQSGKDIPLVMEDGNAPTTRVLNLTEGTQTFVFRNVTGPVVPSILRDFSAPVKIVTQPSDQDLTFRMVHDSDPYNRYVAGESLMLKTIRGLVEDCQNEVPLTLNQDFLDAYAATLAGAHGGEKDMAARMLGLPTYNIIIDGMKTVDPDAVDEALHFLRKTLAEKFKDEFEQVHAETTAPAGEKYDLSAEQLGRRALHNLSLSFLGRLETPEAVAAADQQYQQATNMTEKYGSLGVLARLGGEAGDRALEDFYQRYKDNNNVVDKWLRTQASIPEGDVVARIKGVMKHAAFDLKNPNKVRALMGGFANGNPTAFHNKDGSGYKFLADVVIELNSINPRVAAQIITPLTEFRRYDGDRRELMLGELKRIMKTPDLHAGVKELAGEALEAAQKQKAAVTQRFGAVAKP